MKTIRSYIFNGPQPNDTHAYEIILFILILIDSVNPNNFPTQSKPQAQITQLPLQTVIRDTVHTGPVHYVTHIHISCSPITVQCLFRNEY